MMQRILPRSTQHALLPAELDDESLIAAIPESTLAESCKLVAEAGRRRLDAAVPALATLCRSFAGFGTRHMISEQTAAIEALAIIGGREAAHAVAEMIERAVVQGPGLQVAVSAAVRLGSVLSREALCQMLRHAEPRIRADACRCTRPLPELILSCSVTLTRAWPCRPPAPWVEWGGSRLATTSKGCCVITRRRRRSTQHRRSPTKNARYC
jgi:hypothetical protein